MPAEETPVSAPLTPQQEEKKKLHLESVQRISNLPVISSGINLTSGVYNKVKESNSICRFLFKSAESTVNKATQLAQPVTNVFEKPIKFADSTFCTTMDVVGTTVPKVIETNKKICSKAINVVPVQPAVKCVKTVGSYGKQTVNHLYGKVNNRIPKATSQIPTDQEESEIETDQEKLAQCQAALANGHVKNQAKIFSQ